MTQPMWAADIAIDRALAALLIAVQFPALRSETLEAFGVGWDNAAFLVGGKLLFRFPRRRVAVPLMEREIAILPHVASHVPNAISAPTLLGTASDAYPYAFAGYDLIAGKTACSVALTDGGRCALATPLGRFFRALHDIDPDPLVARG